jgi:predicted ATP-dependent serine protease
MDTTDAELNRWWRGIVPGSFDSLGGEPGIGKVRFCSNILKLPL